MPPTMPTWDQLRDRFNLAAEEQGEWAGAPMPCQTIPLVLEPRYPFQGLNGKCLDNLGGDVHKCSDDDVDDGRYTIANEWWCEWRNATVYVVHDNKTGKARHFKCQDNGYPHRWRSMLNGFEPAQMMDVKAETQAMRTLQEMVSETAFKYYFLLGYFLETSKRSGIIYCFRKLAPTIVLSPRFGDNVRILTTLCLHPIGYYEGSAVGVMVPTDDVIAHLLMMRGDEHKFWSKANQHPPHAFQAQL